MSALRTFVAMAVVLGIASSALAKSPARVAPRPAPSFALPGLGGVVSSDSLRGKVVYVDFWASWCVPCRRSFPWLAAMHEKYGAKGLAVVAINLDKDRAAANRFLDEHPAPFTVAFDPAGRTAEAFHVTAMPSSFIVSPTGVVLESHAGFDPAHASELEARIQTALAR